MLNPDETTEWLNFASTVCVSGSHCLSVNVNDWGATLITAGAADCDGGSDGEQVIEVVEVAEVVVDDVPVSVAAVENCSDSNWPLCDTVNETVRLDDVVTVDEESCIDWDTEPSTETEADCDVDTA